MIVGIYPAYAWYMFCIGLGTGITILAASAYLEISPKWLRILLIASALLMIGRYLTMALFASSPTPERLWMLNPLWLGSMIGLSLPGMVCLDQLVKHPAMNPKKLMKLYSPFLFSYAIIMILGRQDMAFHEIAGIKPILQGWASNLLAITQGIFAVLFIWISVQLFKKIPLKNIKITIAVLALAITYLALESLLASIRLYSSRLFNFSELFMLSAIWFSLQAARKQSI